MRDHERTRERSECMLVITSSLDHRLPFCWPNIHLFCSSCIASLPLSSISRPPCRDTVFIPNPIYSNPNLKLPTEKRNLIYIHFGHLLRRDCGDLYLGRRVLDHLLGFLFLGSPATKDPDSALWTEFSSLHGHI